MLKAWKACKQINSPICWALFMSIIAYISGSMTGRNIYPHHDNMLIFPVIAILINFVRIHSQKHILPKIISNTYPNEDQNSFY